MAVATIISRNNIRETVKDFADISLGVAFSGMIFVAFVM